MKRIVLIISGIMVLILVLGGAAFVGSRMLSQSGPAAQTTGHNQSRVMEMIQDDGSGPRSFRITIAPSPDLPDRAPEVAGIFVRREDNSIFVGTGNIFLDVEVDGDTGQRDVNLSNDGPEVEVVVTRDTVIYQDTTDMDVISEKSESGEITITQEVTPVDSLEEIPKNTEFQTWGQKRGDRLVADILVYRVVDDF
jgi:hypothetical protein